MSLAIGLIAYNNSSSPYLPFFLPSLKAALAVSDFSSFRLFVCDNSDANNETNKIAIDNFLSENPDFPLTYLAAKNNLGFSAAYNLMISQADKMGAHYFLVINPDTILDEKAITEMRRALESNSSLGSVAPRIMSWDFENLKLGDKIDSLGLVMSAGLKFFDLGQGEKLNSYIQKNVSILGPSGACGMFNMKALSAVAEKRAGRLQYFDERFFMYKEDCDLAYRLFLSGYGAKFLDSAVIYHDRTATSSGQGFRKIWLDRKAKSRQIRAWSFLNQHLIYGKFWSKQNFTSRLIILRRILSYFIFSLIFERFLLKEYFSLFKLLRKS